MQRTSQHSTLSSPGKKKEDRKEDRKERRKKDRKKVSQKKITNVPTTRPNELVHEKLMKVTVEMYLENDFH